MIVYVFAYETVTGGEPGVGGFNWFCLEADARACYDKAVKEQATPDVAYFLFEHEVSARAASRVTSAIDKVLVDKCARSNMRCVGANVLRYWRAHRMKMGGAKRAARNQPRREQ